MNYFVEGLQGSGKSTLVRKLAEKYPDHHAVLEGDYSPVDLAWCAYVSEEEYKTLLEEYSDIRQDIEKQSHTEGNRVVICYTKIITDIPGFHKDMEQHEIYNNRMEYDEWKRTILNRFSRWHSDRNIFECSLFQNIVEDMILFHNASDQEIIDFYREICNVLKHKEYRILYLSTDDIAANINVIRKERTGDHGEELWFPLMCGYFDESLYAQKRGISGERALLAHQKHRQDIELSVCREVFSGKVTVLQSKQYRVDEL